MPTATFERRALGATVEVRDAKSGPGTIVGHAAVFYDPADEGTRYMLWDDVEERVMPGAFDRALSEKDNAACLFNHDSNQILGRVASGTLRLSVDKKGLRYESDAPDTQAGRDAVTSIKRGDVTGSSFGFSVTDEEVRKEKRGGKDYWIREIRGVVLYDASPVVFNAYPSADVGAREAIRARGNAAAEAAEIRAKGRAGAGIDILRRRLDLQERA